MPRAPAPPNTAATSTRRISPRHTEASAAASPVTGHCHFTANPCASQGQCLLTRHHMLTTRPVGTKPTTYKRSSGGCTCSAPTRSQQPRKKKEKKQVNGRQTTDGTVNTLRFQGPTRERGEPECTTERRRAAATPWGRVRTHGDHCWGTHEGLTDQQGENAASGTLTPAVIPARPRGGEGALNSREAGPPRPPPGRQLPARCREFATVMTLLPPQLSCFSSTGVEQHAPGCLHLLIR